MNRPEHEGSSFFTGFEVEQTPAKNEYTLFVIGLQPVKEIEKQLAIFGDKITHIYFGANMSFPDINANNGVEWAKWENMIYHFLDRHYWCTLDVDISCIDGIIKTGLCDHYKFIPMISAKLPHVQQLGYNATIKLDDKDFKATNPGVWCHSVHNLLDRSKFTSWDKYSKDEVI